MTAFAVLGVVAVLAVSESSAINLAGLLLVAIIAGAAPVFVARQSGRESRENLRADWERQDKVAERQQAAARAAEAAAEAARVAAVDVAAQVVATTGVTNAKLDVIHSLVNSSMTAAIQAELDARIRELVLMRELLDLKRAGGNEPSSEAAELVEASVAKIGALTVTLAERHAAQAAASVTAPTDAVTPEAVADELATRLTAPDGAGDGTPAAVADELAARLTPPD